MSSNFIDMMFPRELLVYAYLIKKLFIYFDCDVLIRFPPF